MNDPVHDIFRLRPHELNSFFHPKVVAVVGATDREGSVGKSVFWNLLSQPFGGTVYPINSKRASILGVKAYANLKDVPEKIDLIVVTVPAPTVPGVIEEAVSLGIPSAVVISAGFKEIGPEGVKLEKQILEIAKGKMRIIGPNCLGLMSPIIGMNATFATTSAKPGSVAFLSQSGALCTAILDWSLKEHVGFSAFISTGSMADVGWGDLIDYFGNDPKTESIVVYMESVGDARSFVSAAREVSLRKPVIIIKAGRTQAAAKAAASHTGSLTGSDDVLDAAFERCGVLRVDEISEVFEMAEILGKQPLPQGKRLGIVTNAGGPGVLAADALALGGGQLANLSDSTIQRLNEFLPSAWSHSNPVDVLGDADDVRYANSLKVVLDDPALDGILVIMTPQGMTKPLEVAKTLAPYAHFNTKKPVFASWMGGDVVQAGVSVLNEAGIPNFPFPDRASRTFNYLWKYNENLKALYETPETVSGFDRQKTQADAANMLASIRAEGRTLLTEFESKKLLSIYGIPTVTTDIALSADEAATKATAMGFPVVLKLHSLTITHKTDVGGVILNLKSESEVRNAFLQIQKSVSEKASAADFQGVTVQTMVTTKGFELILGSSVDPQFGPVLLFGMGGQLVEVFKDRALALPPLNTTLAQRMIEKTKIYHALLGVRGQKACDLAALKSLLVRFSDLIVENPVISELDINPLILSPEGAIALDARVVLHTATQKDLPKSTIRPYPLKYIETWTNKKDQPLTLRPIRPDDEPALVRFHQRLSETTVYLRYFRNMGLDERTAHQRLTQICFVDYQREITLVAEQNREIVAVGRLKKNFNGREAEVSLVVEDASQGTGLGSRLMRQLVQIAQHEGVERLFALLTEDNKGMARILSGLEFKLSAAGKNTHAELVLK